MWIKTILLLWTAITLGAEPLHIIDRPVSFTDLRKTLTLEYIKEHYGLTPPDIDIIPKIIVIHWTAFADLESSFARFAPVRLHDDREDIRNAGALNTSAHFLVDRDGTIYRLMPETWMARHVIGLNYNSIGIENVGGAEGQNDLTEAQIEADIALIRYLTGRYPTIAYLIGHHEYTAFEDHPLWLEQNPGYRTEKHDPGPEVMTHLRSRLRPLGLKGAPTP